jgi:hypothetical protein
MPHFRWPSLAFGSLRATCIAAALALCVCVPASASALTVAFAGVVLSVRDESVLLDVAIAPGAAVSGTYEVDPSGVVGTSPFAVGPARLAFQIGSYAFDATEASHTIALVDEELGGLVDVWRSGLITTPDLAPATDPGGDFAGYAAQIEFFDFDSAVFNGGETEPFVPADLIGWEQVQLRLDPLVASGGGAPQIGADWQVQVDIESWAVVPVPESRTAVLLAFGLVLLAARAR